MYNPSIASNAKKDLSFFGGVQEEACRKDPDVGAFHSMFSASQTSPGGRKQSGAAHVASVVWG